MDQFNRFSEKGYLGRQLLLGWSSMMLSKVQVAEDDKKEHHKGATAAFQAFAKSLSSK